MLKDQVTMPNQSNHRIRFLWITVVFLLAFSACTPQQAPQPEIKPTISLEPCQLSAPGQVTRKEAKCGTLTVYENREAGSGRQIDLRIAVIPSISRNPAPDPLFFLTGGPGQAATESFPVMASAFERIQQKRDIVLVDQRGTGQSNPLKCPVLDEDLENQADDAYMDFLNTCLESLDADPRLYTTWIAMQDLDQVREALGYQQINLYGVSYGTRAVLTYLKQYPDRVRSVILDGVVPQDEVLGIDVGRDAQRALDMIFARCAADQACNQA
ncbi:MAG: alpha/beta fold hydrolase, partial [Chloroflexota bacterium]